MLLPQLRDGSGVPARYAFIYLCYILSVDAHYAVLRQLPTYTQMIEMLREKLLCIIGCSSG